MKNLLLFLFNTCWITSTWLWNISRTTLIKKPGKKSYEQCSSSRPLSNSSHVGKLFERIISARLKLYFETHNILMKNKKVQDSSEHYPFFVSYGYRIRGSKAVEKADCTTEY